ncbi:MAG: HAD-IB family phosphatase [Hyphomicrobium sp.]|uniref:HAD family hydrolase n=1 Tax=Hyphomicrobium sp. TaxID=82 RepID=UPI0039E364B8
MSPRNANADVCLCDWDGTLRKGFMFQTWIPFLAKALSLPDQRVSAFHTLFDDFKHHRISYENLVDGVAIAYAELVAGASCADVRSVARRFAERDQAVFPFVKSLVARLAAHGIDTIIVSGSPSDVLEAFAESLGVRKVFALRIICDDDGTYAARVQKNYGNYAEKLSCVMQLKERHAIKAAFGDSTADIPLLAVADARFIVRNASVEDPALTELRGPPIRSLDPDNIDLDFIIGEISNSRNFADQI